MCHKATVTIKTKGLVCGPNIDFIVYVKQLDVFITTKSNTIKSEIYANCGNGIDVFKEHTNLVINGCTIVTQITTCKSRSTTLQNNDLRPFLLRAFLIDASR